MTSYPLIVPLEILQRGPSVAGPETPTYFAVLWYRLGNFRTKALHGFPVDAAREHFETHCGYGWPQISQAM